MKTASTDTEAWYLQPWPWFLIALPATAVVASLVSAFLAVQSADTLLEENYYQRGLGINSELQRVARAEDLGIHADVEYSGIRAGESVWVGVRSAKPVTDTALQIRLIHPGRAGADRVAVLARIPNSPDTHAEFLGAWPDGVAVPNANGVHWRIALNGGDWQVEGDASGRYDLAAR